MAVDTFESPIAASDRVEQFVASHPFGAAAIVGLIATQMATLVGYFFIGVGLPQLHPRPLYNGVLVIFNKDFSQFAASAYLRRPVDPHDRRGRLHAPLCRCSVRAVAGTGHPGRRPSQGDHLRRDPRPDQHGLPGALCVRTEDGARVFQLLRPEHLEAAAGHRHLAPCLRRVPRAGSSPARSRSAAATV